jgi:hypothetical protein
VNFAPGEDRLVVSDYFLVQDLFPSGVVRVDGDHKAHAIDIVNRPVELPRWRLSSRRLGACLSVAVLVR